MSHSSTAEFRKKLVQLHVKEGRTYKELSAEYAVPQASISMWCRDLGADCREETPAPAERAPADAPPLLLALPFRPGHCLEAIGHIKDAALRDLARMQYDYFTCRHEQAAERAAGYLDAEDVKIRIAALLIFAFSSMAAGRGTKAQEAVRDLRALIARQDSFARESGIPLLLSAAKTVLHIPVADKERGEIAAQSSACTEGGRLLCCFLLEQAAWNGQKWERVIGSAETALHMTREPHPLIALYFYLSASEAALRLKDIRRAEVYFQKAWTLAAADGFWSPVSEMHGHIQLFLEKEVKRAHPAAYKQIIQATHQYRSGWKALILEETPPKEKQKKEHMQETLTGMEYAVSFLAELGWHNQEIADYFSISVRTVKYYMTAAFTKLNIDCRQKISGLLD